MATMPRLAGHPSTVRAVGFLARRTRLADHDRHWIGDRPTSGDNPARLLLALAKLSGRGGDSAAIRFSTLGSKQPSQADRVLGGFARYMSPAIEATLSRAASR